MGWVHEEEGGRVLLIRAKEKLKVRMRNDLINRRSSKGLECDDESDGMGDEEE